MLKKRVPPDALEVVLATKNKLNPGDGSAVDKDVCKQLMPAVTGNCTADTPLIAPKLNALLPALDVVSRAFPLLSAQTPDDILVVVVESAAFNHNVHPVMFVGRKSVLVEGGRVKYGCVDTICERNPHFCNKYPSTCSRWPDVNVLL